MLQSKRDHPPFTIESFCFKEQIDFIRDERQFKTAVCSRRSGKTVACAADLIDTALKFSNVVCLYITLKRVNASRIIWPELLRINREHKLGGVPNETYLSLKFPNSSVIYCSGAKDKSEIENFRGLALKKVYIDECFHRDTLIDTPDGKTPISALRAGDQVYNAVGIGTVTHVSRKLISDYVELNYGKQKIICSTNHPFFTERGWVNAGELKKGDLLASHQLSMRLLSESKPKGQVWKTSNSEILRDILLKEVSLKRDFSTYDKRQSNEAGNYSQQIKNKASCDGTQATNSRRQWHWADCTGENGTKVFSEHDFSARRTTGQQRKRLPVVLQAGYSLSEMEDRHRNRRQLPLCSEQTRAGQEEGKEIGFIRLDDIKVQKFTSDARAADRYFYDISVDGHPSYVVNGALVHNCQSFRPHIEELIDDVISKALFDYSGQLCLIGTPGMVPAGYFYKCATSNAWSHHAWTMFDNPYIERKSGKPVLTLIQDDCKRMGVELTHPKIQRECYGRWVTDLDSLVFKYDARKNHYESVDCQRDWEFVIGVDVGFDDADAIAVIGWHKHQKISYLIREEVKTKQGITELSEQLDALIKEFDPLRVVMDTGGLGKKIAEEMRRRYTLPIVAAEKSRKFEFIELLNDAMRTGRFFAKNTGRFAQDSMLVEWDREKSTPDRLVVSDGYHSDINDAVLYGFRESLHWLTEPAPENLIPMTPAWMRKQEQEMEAAALASIQPKDEDVW